VDKMGGKPAEAQPVLLGIPRHRWKRKVSSARPRSRTHAVLTEAATLAKVGLPPRIQGNVIMVTSSPPTGYDYHRKVQLTRRLSRLKRNGARAGFSGGEPAGGLPFKRIKY